MELKSSSQLVSRTSTSEDALLTIILIGGWGGCQYYSALMKTSANRTTFINALSSTVNEYDLDGKLYSRYVQCCPTHFYSSLGIDIGDFDTLASSSETYHGHA